MYADGGRELEETLRRVKAEGITTSLDMARPDPASEAGRVPWSELLARVLPHVDVFLPSFDETLFMLDRPRFDRLEQETSGDLIKAADAALLNELSGRLLEMGVAVAALKLGAEGLYLRTTDDQYRLASLAPCAPKEPPTWNGRELLAPCFQVKVVGTTGSGDATIAGFLAGLLHGLAPEQVITAAVAVGACNVEGADAVSSIPTWEEIQHRLRAGWPHRQVAASLPGWTWDEERGLWRGPQDLRPY
jgi:sugar/nucleoside kinase (ribokinase family)